MHYKLPQVVLFRCLWHDIILFFVEKVYLRGVMIKF